MLAAPFTPNSNLHPGLEERKAKRRCSVPASEIVAPNLMPGEGRKLEGDLVTKATTLTSGYWSPSRRGRGRWTTTSTSGTSESAVICRHRCCECKKNFKNLFKTSIVGISASLRKRTAARRGRSRAGGPRPPSRQTPPRVTTTTLKRKSGT